MKNHTLTFFVEAVNIFSSKTIWEYFASMAAYPTRLRLTGQLNITDIQILPICRCLKYLQINWTGIMLNDDMEHCLTLPSKGQISVWTVNDLKHIGSREPLQIQIFPVLLITI